MDSDEGTPENAPDIVTQLSERQRLRVEVIQELMVAPDRATYRQRQQSAAERLGLSLSSIQRLVWEWKQKGIAGLSWRNRSDRGQFRISEDWQAFIVKTYQEGNRGSRSLTPLQVAVRVKVRAQELGVDPYPSHMTVYRLLNPLIEQHAQPPLKGSIDWNGSRLLVKTREGLEIAIKWSNQVWQVDHTLADVFSGGSIEWVVRATVDDDRGRYPLAVHHENSLKL